MNVFLKSICPLKPWGLKCTQIVSVNLICVGYKVNDDEDDIDNNMLFSGQKEDKEISSIHS